MHELIILLKDVLFFTVQNLCIINNKKLFLSAAGGDLRRYLDGLANAENMVKYVEQHPFGQQRITEKSEFWDFYLKVINSLSVCQSEK
jgi:hypothetical protein